MYLYFFCNNEQIFTEFPSEYACKYRAESEHFGIQLFSTKMAATIYIFSYSRQEALRTGTTAEYNNNGDHHQRDNVRIITSASWIIRECLAEYHKGKIVYVYSEMEISDNGIPLM